MTIKIVGVDMSNLNSIVLPFNLRGEQVDDPGDPRPIPTLNEWGLPALSAFVFLISVYYLWRQRRSATEI